MTFIEILKNILEILPSILIISFTSFLILKLFKITDFIEKIILLFLLNFCQIILTIEILSLFKRVTITFIYFTILLIFIICLTVALFKKISFRIDISCIKIKLLNFYKNIETNSVLKIFIISWLVIILLATLILGFSSPPKNWDALTCYLVRPVIWIQNQTINHYYINHSYQLSNPINPSIAFLWIMIFTKSDYIVFLLQWFSLLIVILTIYKILRTINFNRFISIFTVLIFSTTGIAILEASTTQHDLILTAFILISCYLILKIFKDKDISINYLLFFGLSSGLALGSKSYAFLFIPGFLLFAIFYNGFSKKKLIKIVYLLLFSTLGFILFTSHNLIQNYYSFGSIMGDKNLVDMTMTNSISIKSFIGNYFKYYFSFYEFSEFDFKTFGALISKFLNKLYNILGLQIDGIYKYEFTKFRPNIDSSYFGPIVFFILLPSILINFLFLFSKKIRANKELILRFKTSLFIFLIPSSFFLLFTLLINWQPYAGRYLIPFVAILFVNFAILLEFLKNIDKRQLTLKITTILLLLICIPYSFINLFLNIDANIIPFKFNNKEFKTIYSMPYEDRRYTTYGSQWEPLNNFIQKNVRENSKIGIYTMFQSWDYLFFGKNFGRKIFYVSKEELMSKQIEDILSEKELDYVLIYKNGLEFENIKYGAKIGLKSLETENIGDYVLFYR